MRPPLLRTLRPRLDHRRARLSALGALMSAGVLVGCSAGTTVTSAPSTSAATTPATSAPTKGTTVGTTTAAPGTTAPTTADDPGSGSLPPGVSGGRLYADPKEVIKADVGVEFAIRLPAREGASWTWADNCINVELLDTKTDRSGSRAFRFRMVVAGACWLDFYAAEQPDLTAPADVRFTVEDSDL